MYQWVTMRGKNFKEAPEYPTHLGSLPNQPFPWNPFFRSDRVLSPELKKTITKRVNQENWSLKAVSADMGIDVRRVAAVLRMEAIEEDFRAKGKQLATPFAKVLEGMLPQTKSGKQHEPINELHVHKLSMQQLFVPVSESREFSRKDAAKAFHRDLLTPDARSPHPELIKMEKAVGRGVDRATAQQEHRLSTKEREDAQATQREERRVHEENQMARIQTPRFEFRFRDVNVEVAGKDGRGRKAIGMRYGVPFNDRRKGAVKIPTTSGY